MSLVERIPIRNFLIALMLLFGLAACTGQTPDAPLQALSSETPTALATVSPSPTSEGISDLESSETSMPVESEQPEKTPSATAQVFNGIPYGTTETGYPYLGEPDAPVTLVDYSDFL